MKVYIFQLFLFKFVCFDRLSFQFSQLSFAFKVFKVTIPGFRKSAIFVEKKIKNPQIFDFILNIRIFLSKSIKI